MLLVSLDQVDRVDGLLAVAVVVLILPPTLLVMVVVLVDHTLVVVRDKIQPKQLPVELLELGVEAVAWELAVAAVLATAALRCGV